MSKAQRAAINEMLRLPRPAGSVTIEQIDEADQALARAAQFLS